MWAQVFPVGTARPLSDPLLLFESVQGIGLLLPISNRILPTALDEEGEGDSLCPNGHWPFLPLIRQHVFLAFLRMGYNWCLSVKLVGT